MSHGAIGPSKPIPVPPMLKPGEIASACGISKGRALTDLDGAGLVEKLDNGHRRVSSTRLRARFPSMYDLVYAWFELGRRPLRKGVKRGQSGAIRHDSDGSRA